MWRSACAGPTQPDLIQRKLFTVHHHIYASAEYLKKHGIPKSLEDLDKHKIVTFGQAPGLSDAPSTGWNTSAARKATRAPWRCASTMPMACAAPCRPAWASPRWPITSCREDSGLVQIDLPVETPEFDTYFVYPEELKDTKRVTVFRDFLVAKAKEWSF